MLFSFTPFFIWLLVLLIVREFFVGRHLVVSVLDSEAGFELQPGH